MSNDTLEELFPNLHSDNYQITSEEATRYNCIAWALNHTTLFWDPGMIGVRGYYWPPDAPKDDSVQAWVRIFEIHGYEKCESAELEESIEKVAIYGKVNGEATHVARQLSSGAWTSKLRKLEDIEHKTLNALEGDYNDIAANDYGAVVQILCRVHSR